MRRALWFFLLVACREEPQAPRVVASPPDPVVEKVARVPAETATVAVSSTTAGPGPEPAPKAQADRSKAEAARARVLAKRRAVAAEVEAARQEIDGLERRLRVTGHRNERRRLLAALGKARSRLTDAKSVSRRCEEAFEGSLWVEIEETWLLAEDLESRTEAKAATEAYERYARLVAEFLPSCEPLPPMEGKPNRFR